jgi:hypothetical protein
VAIVPGCGSSGDADREGARRKRGKCPLSDTSTHLNLNPPRNGLVLSGGGV